MITFLIAVALFLSQRTVAPAGSDSLGNDEVVFVEDEAPGAPVAAAPVPSSPGHAAEQAEELLSSYGGMLADSNPDGELVDLFSAAVDYEGEGLSLAQVEEQLTGLGTLRLAYDDTPAAQFARNGGPVGAGWAGGLGGFGVYGGRGYGNAPLGGDDSNYSNGNGNGAGQNTLQNSDSQSSGASNNGQSNTPGGTNTPAGPGSDGAPNGPPDGLPTPARAGGPGATGGLTTSTTPISVPEPSVLLLAGMGLTGLATIRRRRAQ